MRYLESYENGTRHSRSVSEITGVINVKDFGARGDGTVDDAPAIQAAIDYAKFRPMANGGNVRAKVLFPYGIYYIKEVINITNVNGLWLEGGGSKYVSTHITGDTGAQIFDFTGAIMSGCSGFTFVTENGWLTPSTIAVQFALSQDANGNQVGGLNCGINNCFFQMKYTPTANGGLGSLGVLNIMSEEFFASDLLIKADIGMVFSTNRNLTPITPIPFTATSKFTQIKEVPVSMGVSRVLATKIQNIQQRNPALLLYNVNSFHFDGYLVQQGTIGTNNTAIRLVGQADNVDFKGTIEGFSQVIKYATENMQIRINAVIANQARPAVPLVDVTGSYIADSDCKVTVPIPSEFNNGRFFVWHDAIGGGNEPATGQIINSSFSNSRWVNNGDFVSANVLKNASNVSFNSGQPFVKVGQVVKDTKSYNKVIGPTVVGSNTITANCIRFLKADNALKTSSNGGFYQATIKGTVKLGGNVTGGNAGVCVAHFTSYLTLAQKADGTYGVQESNTTINGLSTLNSAYLNITDINTAFDMSGEFGVVTLTVDYFSGGAGEPIATLTDVEFLSDFKVNQSVTFE